MHQKDSSLLHTGFPKFPKEAPGAKAAYNNTWEKGHVTLETSCPPTLSAPHSADPGRRGFWGHRGKTRFWSQCYAKQTTPKHAHT